jgi:hypothetical protein
MFSTKKKKKKKKKKKIKKKKNKQSQRTTWARKNLSSQPSSAHCPVSAM